MSRRAAVVLSLAVFFGVCGTAGAAFPGANGRIVYASDEYALNLDIFVIRDTGGPRVRLAKSTDTERNPAWSPNGDRIAYQRDVQLAGPEIWVMNADGSGKTRLGPGGNPTWSPDGDKIAYVGLTGNSWDGIHVMNDDGTNQVALTSGGTNSVDPHWSPDGAMLTFERSNDVFIMDADGSNVVNRTNSAASDHNPSWGPGSISS